VTERVLAPHSFGPAQPDHSDGAWGKEVAFMLAWYGLVPSGQSRFRPGARLLLAALAAGSLVAADTAVASVLIVRSAGPSAKTYRPGKALPDDAKVALTPGDVVVVLAADSARTLRGPGTFSLASLQSAARPAVNALRRGRFSALRNAGIVPRSPTLWHVDVSQGGKTCLTDPRNVQLWRPDAAEPLSVTLSQAGGASQTTLWPAGQATLAWPATLPVVAGAEYRISWDGKAEPTSLTFVPLASEPTDLTSVAQALIEQDCKNQLDLLIETVPAETAAAGE